MEQLHSSVARRGSAETIQPGERTVVSVRRRVVAYVLAIVLPVVTAIALIPVRVDHARVVLLVLVLPVVVVALLGTSGPAIVAAACAVLAFDFFLAQPYYSLAIEDSDEIVAAATFFAVALVVGVLNARLVRSHIRDSARREELRHLIAFARTVAGGRDEAILTGAACEHIASVLHLDECEWQPGGERSSRPALLADGNLMGRLVDLNPDRATLPEQIEIPVWVDESFVGRFVLTSSGREIVSIEERRTAATIAELFGRRGVPRADLSVRSGACRPSVEPARPVASLRLSERERHSGGVALLAFGALGIVSGDIGTSPLYAFRETFHHADLEVTKATTYGAASVAFWALVIVICLKYLATVMRADNHGEGGILALTSLVIPPEGQVVSRVAAGVVTLGVFGTALLYGDGLITPAISVLSAVEGFEVATPALERWVIPIAVVILVCLFVIQRRGTAGIAKVFSPVMVVWFIVLGILGTNQIRQAPGVMRAISPTYAVQLFVEHPWKAFIALGSIFLVVTGGEALYADMGHFGRVPITWAWYVLVLPGLVLNYFGQAALLSGRPTDHIGDLSPFYAMSPDWAITPLAILATMATVIASQALISGVFSLTVQAVQLDYLPRLAILHTSERHIGQVYVPLVNWLLMVGCVGLVVVFQTSTALAAAYGIAVTTTMLITTLIFYRFARDKWSWSKTKALVVLIPFMIVDIGFLSANVPKIPHGGWFPLLVGFGLVIQMTTWRKGRQLVAARIRRGERPMREVVDEAIARGAARVPGVAIYMFKDEGAAPPALMSNLRHNRVMHSVVLLVSVHTADTPRVEEESRANVTDLGNGIELVRFNYGFMEDPDIPSVLAGLDLDGADLSDATYFLGRESVTAGKAPGMHPWREELFVLLNRGAASASRFFKLPAEQVFEVGSHVEI